MPDGYTKGRAEFDVGWWDGAIRKGKEFRSTLACESSWPMWRRWYRGQWQPSTLPSNIYFKIARTFIPRVYYRNPSVSITPSKPGVDNMVMCKLIERMDNKLLTVMKVKESMKRAVQHGFMLGTGGLRLGYGAEFTPTPDELGTEAPEAGSARRRKRVEYNDLVQPNRPWILPAHPGNVVVPFGTESIHDARWVCFESYRAVDDVKMDKRLKNNQDIGEGVGDSKMLSARAQSARKATQRRVLLREVRDKKTGMVFVYAPFADSQPRNPRSKVLFEGEDDLQRNGRLNYYPLVFNPDDEAFWGVPLSKIIEPIQLEKNETRTMMMRHRRISIAKMLTEAGAISPDEESKLIDGNSRGVVKVKDITKVREFPPSQMPAGLIEEDELMDREAQELMGLGVNQFGEYAPGSSDRSATEAQIVNQATQIRIDEYRDACADLLVDIVEDMNELIAYEWTGDMVVDIIGPAGVPVWVRFNPEMVRNSAYDLNVDPDTSLPMTKQMREQRAIQAFGLLKTNPLINPIELTRFLLNEMYGTYADNLMYSAFMNTSVSSPMEFQKVVQEFTQMPQPNAQAMQQLQGQMGGVGPPVAGGPPSVVGRGM